MNSESQKIDSSREYAISDRWCRYIIRTCYISISINIVFLIIVWYFFVFNVYSTSPFIYWGKYILFPSMCMLAVNFIADRLIQDYSVSLLTKEYIVLMLIVFFCAFLCIVHSITAVLLASFAVPVFISTIFVNFKITKNIFIVSQIVQILCGIKMCFFSTRAFGNWIWIELLVASAILIISFLMAKLLIQSGQYNIASLINSDNDRQKLKEQLQRDPLTGLYNRKAYAEFIHETIAESRGSNSCLSLAMLDLDNFKKINDTFGHATGDKVLLRLAHILLNNSSESIYAFRLGGEEFCLILKGYCVEDAYKVCEGIRELLVASYISGINNKRITFSCGIACMNRKYTDPISLYQAADSALYKAKNNGKNQTMLFDGAIECIHPEKKEGVSEDFM